MVSRQDRIRYTRWAGTVVAVLGATSTAISAAASDPQGVGWGATIIIGGLLLRHNADVLELNERLLKNQQNAIESNIKLAEENERLREQQIRERHDYERRE